MPPTTIWTPSGRSSTNWLRIRLGQKARLRACEAFADALSKTFVVLGPPTVATDEFPATLRSYRA
jgi:hypothetical protein